MDAGELRLPAVCGQEGTTSHDVCVVVVSHDDKCRLGSALAGVLGHDGGWLDLDVVVVDNGNRWKSACLEAQAAYARMQFARKHFPWGAADYPWALAFRVCLYSLLRRYESGRRQAATSALATVLKGPSALRRVVRVLMLLGLKCPR